MAAAQPSFWFRITKVPRPRVSFSTFAGTVLGTFNVGVQLNAIHYPDNIEYISWTRPLCEVIAVAGLVVTTVLWARHPENYPTWHFALSSVGHTVIGLSVFGAEVRREAVLVAGAVLLAALGAYWASGVWPYSLSPVEAVVLCFCMLAIRLI